VPDLASELRRLDGKSYGAYRDLRGRVYPIGESGLCLEHVQGDPFAAPSRVRIDVPAAVAGLPALACGSADARRAASDFVQRRLRALLTHRRAHDERPRDQPKRRTPTGGSGALEIAALGQEVLDRTAVRVGADGSVVIRLAAGLPAAGRIVLGRAAAELLAEDVPYLLTRAFGSLDASSLEAHVRAVEDQVAMRDALTGMGLVAFVADGSILPRRSGADDRPMAEALAFVAPETMRVAMVAPHAGRLTGLAVRRGVTLIAGGGYHGKSTLLQALSRGVYDHVPGDGRERCVTVGSAVGIRAEDGRSVRGVDLRAFIANLPLGRSTEAFDTDDASGSTSQAAAIVEALEVGATALLIDEDTAASNFMIRDARMRALIAAEAEPITPFLDRVRQLHEQRGVSSVLVVGGAGDYLDVADAVVQMHEYRPVDVTEKARQVAEARPLGDAAPRAPGDWPNAAARIPARGCLDPSRGNRAERARGVRTRMIEFGAEEIDVSLLSQLVDPAQCRMIGDALIACSRGLCDGETSMVALLDAIDGRIEERGLESIAAPGFGDRARARRFEIAAAINRLRALRIEATAKLTDAERNR
jgi:predicted ABC-class ATPase